MITIRLQELAEAKELNKNQVARKTGLDIGMIRRYWDNDTSAISLSALDILCELLECDPGDFLERVPEPQQEAPHG